MWGAYGGLKMDIFGIKTDSGYYITGNLRADSYRSGSNLTGYIVNGGKPQETFHRDWLWVGSEPKEVKKIVKQPNINHRFELVSDSFASSDIPRVMPKHEIMEENEDGYCGWKEEFKHLQSLYEEKSDKQPDILEPIEFTYTTILEVPEIKIAEDFNYGSIVSQGDIKHQIIDEIIFPDIVLPNKPSKLTSHQSYNIVRNHIKQNINMDVSKITSDYDFCFTVKKKVILSSPRHIKNEILNARGRSYQKRRYREYYVKEREVEVFEMTYFPKCYSPYTPIRGFTGRNHQDLQKNIDKYLKEIMEIINTPLKDCHYCDGMGVIITET